MRMLVYFINIRFHTATVRGHWGSQSEYNGIPVLGEMSLLRTVRCGQRWLRNWGGRWRVGNRRRPGSSLCSVGRGEAEVAACPRAVPAQSRGGLSRVSGQRGLPLPGDV